MTIIILLTAARQSVSIVKTTEDSKNDAFEAVYYLYTAFGTAAGVG